MQHVHENRQLGLDEGTQTVLESRDDVLHHRRRNTLNVRVRKMTRICANSNELHLQPLYDVPVVPRRRHYGVSPYGVASRESPAHGRLLDDVIGFHKQVVHLVVQVHRYGYSSAFGWWVSQRHTSSVVKLLWDYWNLLKLLSTVDGF